MYAQLKKIKMGGTFLSGCQHTVILNNKLYVLYVTLVHSISFVPRLKTLRNPFEDSNR